MRPFLAQVKIPLANVIVKANCSLDPIALRASIVPNIPMTQSYMMDVLQDAVIQTMKFW